MMRRRLEQFERRLAALKATLEAWAADREEDRRAREQRARIAALLRAGLEQAGLDPDESPSLRHIETPEPPAKPAVHPLRRLAERERPLTLGEALYDMTRRHHKGPAPDLRHASVMELIGYYCFGAGNPDARAAPA